MYAKEQIDDCEWAILDPQGDTICTLFIERDADALLSHLNR